MLDSGTFLLSPVGSCVRFTCEKQGVGLGWGNLLIAVRFWLNFRIPTVAFSGVDVTPAQCVRCTWVFGRSGVGRGGRVNSYVIVHFRHFGPGSPIHSRGNYMDTTKGDPPRNSCQGGKLIAVRFWLNFRIPDLALPPPAQP